MVGPAARKRKVMSKTYVIRANPADASTPYTAYAFTGRVLAQKWFGYDPKRDLLFSTAVEIAEDHDYFLVKSVFDHLGLSGIVNDKSTMDVCVAIYRWAVATAAFPEKKEVKMTEETPATEELPNVKSIKKQKKLTKEPSVSATREPKHKVYANDQIVERKLEKPPIAAGSKRYTIMEAVMAASTVGEALIAARKAGGGPTDLDIAVQKGAIEVK